MRSFAEYVAQEIGHQFPTGVQIKNISAPADRYSMYKVGPVLSVSVSYYTMIQKKCF